MVNLAIKMVTDEKEEAEADRSCRPALLDKLEAEIAWTSTQFWENLSSLAFVEVRQRRSNLKTKKVSAEIAWTSAQFPCSTLNTNGSIVGQTGAAASSGALRDW
ncbi:hypothetical protein LINPERPRIM_LOCUS13516 [Linum perenne]